MKKTTWRRISIVFAVPFILVVILYFLFSVKGCLEIGQSNIENDIKPFIRNTLQRQEQRLEFITPIIDPRWFLYSVSFQNNKKLAVESKTAEPRYTERETLLTLIIDGQEQQILYGENKIISSNIKREEILNKFSGYGFSFKGDPKQKFGPGQLIEIQDSPNLGVACYNITLSFWSLPLIYLFTLIAWSGLILIAKPVFQFVYFGKQWWLKI